MIIITHSTSNPKIKLIELVGELTGSGAIELQESLSNCLDEGKYYQIINLERIAEIDSMGINILQNFANRGMQIRLFNVKPEVRRMFEISEKEDISKIYNETDCDKAVSLLEKDILGKEVTIKNNVKARRYPRTNIFFPMEFKYCSDHNREILFKANALNLSEGGICANQVRAINIEIGKTVSMPGIIGRELCKLKFKLNLNSGFIETKGDCVWENKTDREFSVGIRFKDIIEDDKQRIRDYIYNAFRF